MIQKIADQIIFDVVVLLLKGTCTRSNAKRAIELLLSVYVPRDEQPSRIASSIFWTFIK